MRAIYPMLLAPLRHSNMQRRSNMQDASHAAMLENIQALLVGPGLCRNWQTLLTTRQHNPTFAQQRAVCRQSWRSRGVGC